MHTWGAIITENEENVEVGDVEDDFTLIIDTETTEGKKSFYVFIML